MTLMKQLASIFESEQGQLRKLYAAGQPLPPKPEPSWVRSQPMTSVGMVRLPPLERVEGLGSTYDTPFWSIFWLVIGASLLWIGFLLTESFYVNLMYLLGVACLAGALFSWTDQMERLDMRPEAATIVYSPGDTLLVMLPRQRRSSGVRAARLIYRRRWLVAVGEVIYWEKENLIEIPVQFTQPGANLLRASIRLPDDAAGSYHANEYRHDWLLAIDHVNVWGYPRTDLFLLWIAP